MKKVIRGRVYDTATAKEIGNVSGGADVTTDFNYWEETLYQKKTGEFFLYGFGGALSKYKLWVGNSGGSGEKIIPLTYEQAQEWAEKALDGEKYIEIFGDPEENVDKKAITLSITKGAADILRKAAEKTDKSSSSIVEDLIRKNLK